MRIFVTGGTGFIGRHLLKRLCEQKHDIHALSRLAKNIDSRVKWHTGNLFNTQLIESILSAVKPDYLIHLAWYVDHEKFWTDPINDQYVLATLNLYQAFNKVSGSKAIFIGSAAEYGKNKSSCYGEMTTPLIPTTPYGCAKKRTLELILNEKKINPKAANFTWIRLFNIFGPGEHFSRFIPSIFINYQQDKIPFIQRPNLICDYISVTDFVDLIIFLLWQKSPHILNVGSGHQHSLLSIASLINKICYPHLGAPKMSDDIAIEKFTPDLHLLKILNPPKVTNLSDSLIQLKNWYETNRKEEYETHY